MARFLNSWLMLQVRVSKASLLGLPILCLECKCTGWGVELSTNENIAFLLPNRNSTGAAFPGIKRAH